MSKSKKTNKQDAAEVNEAQRSLILELILLRHAEWIGSMPPDSIPAKSVELDRQCLLALLASTDAELRHAHEFVAEQGEALSRRGAENLELVADFGRLQKDFSDFRVVTEETEKDYKRQVGELRGYIAKLKDELGLLRGENTRLAAQIEITERENKQLSERIKADNPPTGDGVFEVFP